MRNRKTTVDRQRARLRELQGDSRAVRERRRALVEWFAKRRPVDDPRRKRRKGPDGGCGDGPPEHLPPIEVIDWAGDGEALPVVAGELFIRVGSENRDRFPELRRTLKSRGWNTVDDPDANPAGVVRFTAQDRRNAALEQTLRMLKEDNWRCGPNHILPLNWSVKGKIGPEITCEPLPDHGGTKPSGARLIAIDTGLASKDDRDRTDGWLANAAGDVDPLDEVDRNGNLQPDGCLDLGAGHGTSVAGVAECVEPAMTVEVLRALGPDGVGDERLIAEKVLAAAGSLKGRGVINLSFGSQSYDDEAPIWLEAEFEKLGLTKDDSQLCVVAAAGNWGDEQKSWPAALPGVIAVAGLTEDGGPTTWSTRGDWVRFSAQGEGIVAPYVVGKETPGTSNPADPYDDYPDRWDGPNPNAMWLGTSFAAPQVAARLAQHLHDNPDATCASAVKWLAEQGRDAGDGFGVRLPQLWAQCHGPEAEQGS